MDDTLFLTFHNWFPGHRQLLHHTRFRTDQSYNRARWLGRHHASVWWCGFSQCLWTLHWSMGQTGTFFFPIKVRKQNYFLHSFDYRTWKKARRTPLWHLTTATLLVATMPTQRHMHLWHHPKWLSLSHWPVPSILIPGNSLWRVQMGRNSSL